MLGDNVCSRNDNLSLFGRGCNYLADRTLGFTGDYDDGIVFLDMKLIHTL